MSRSLPRRRIKIGVLANEFFDPSLGRMGGFGWAARQVARCFQDLALGVDVVFLTGELRAASDRAETRVHGTRLLLRQPDTRADVRRARAEGLDLLLLIDYRPNYLLYCRGLPGTPTIVWVRDPRPPDDVAKVNTLRVPGAPDVPAKGTFQPDCSSLGAIARASRSRGRVLLFASPAPSLCGKLEAMIRMDIDRFFFLPNPVDLAPDPGGKHDRARVVFLARLDPYKRPWLCVELARRFPDVEFLLAGKAHFHGNGAWEPDSLPPNVHLLGHIDGPDKVRVLTSAWVLVNTSIHEGLPVSFLEALACETPILACVDPEGVVSRYGVYAGRFDGAGLDAIDRLEAGLRRLLDDAVLRTRLGRSGRRWVEENHSPPRFLTAFHSLCARAGLTTG